MSRYCYSLNTEYFNGDCETPEEAISEGIHEEALEVGDILYVAEQEPKSFMDFFDADYLFENMNEKAGEEVPVECVDSWPMDIVTTAAKQELSELIDKWATKHNLQPPFWGVHHPFEEITITQAMLDKSIKDYL